MGAAFPGQDRHVFERPGLAERARSGQEPRGTRDGQPVPGRRVDAATDAARRRAADGARAARNTSADLRDCVRLR